MKKNQLIKNIFSSWKRCEENQQINRYSQPVYIEDIEFKNLLDAHQFLTSTFDKSLHGLQKSLTNVFFYLLIRKEYC